MDCPRVLCEQRKLVEVPEAWKRKAAPPIIAHLDGAYVRSDDAVSDHRTVGFIRRNGGSGASAPRRLLEGDDEARIPRKSPARLLDVQAFPIRVGVALLTGREPDRGDAEYAR